MVATKTRQCWLSVTDLSVVPREFLLSCDDILQIRNDLSLRPLPGLVRPFWHVICDKNAVPAASRQLRAVEAA